MKQIYANNFATLALGRKGENLARQVVFDVRDLESLYGPGDVEVIYQRPGDAQPYPLAVQRDGTLVTWDVTATDTEMSNAYGKCELRYYVGETLAKSKIWRTWVEPALPTPSETAPPEPEQGWVDQVLAAKQTAEKAAADAKADADLVSSLAAEVAVNAAQTAQDASKAAKAMEAAQTAKHLAEEAQGAAETARTAAETAQAAAEQSATDAAGAKQDAETALKSAQDAAAAAAKVLADIRALYQEMQTWAHGVIQDVNDAGSVAVRSVQTAGDTQVQRVTDEGTTQTANAKAQADAAAQSAAGAAQSAQEAAGSASTASTSETNAKASEESAKASQTAAAGSASSAANSAASASAAASAASESAAAAAASETAAKASEEAAKASETAAKASETAAAESASAAQQSATSAAESAAVYDDVVADVNQLKQEFGGNGLVVDLRGYTLSEDGNPTVISDISYDPIYEAIKAGRNVVFQLKIGDIDVFEWPMLSGVAPGNGLMVALSDTSLTFTNGSYHTTE